MEQFETVDQAVDFIASAPCLKYISLWGVSCSESCNYSLKAVKAVAPPLREIKIEPSPLVVCLMDWFCRCHPTPSVHTLNIDLLDSPIDIIPTACNFIRHLGSSLEHLVISCSDADHRVQSKCILAPYFINANLIILSGALSKQIDLSQNSSLRTIFFNGINLHRSSDLSRSCGWITSIVSTLAHPSLEFVTIAFLGNLEAIKTYELSGLENLFLNQPLSDYLTKLRLFIMGSTEESRAAFKNRLPKLDGEKRLEFSRYVVFIL